MLQEIAAVTAEILLQISLERGMVACDKQQQKKTTTSEYWNLERNQREKGLTQNGYQPQPTTSYPPPPSIQSNPTKIVFVVIPAVRTKRINCKKKDNICEYLK